ncbi:MAG: tcdA [Cyanobacteria bacterium RYN_339]|nr:tcdA [Cyanobacteria bacterium RYN_339]
MLHRFSRTELLIGASGYERLQGANVAVFGLGGVGSYAAEALARAAVGKLTLVDYDLVCATNVNRQLHAMIGTIGKPKAEVMAERTKKINPKVEVQAVQQFYSAQNADELLAGGYDYVIDAIDNVTAKLHLIASAHGRGMRVISAMGAANKLDPTQIRVADIAETHTCPLARDVRKELRKKYDIERGVTVVFSTESPIFPDADVANCEVKCICPPTHMKGVNDCEQKSQINGTISYLPAMFGLMMAGTVVQHLMQGVELPRRDAGHACSRLMAEV